MYEHKDSSPNVFQSTAKYKPARSWRSWLIGTPLQTADAENQTIGKAVGLAVFSSDALSSVAYGPQELMMIIAAAGVAALPNAMPIAIAIVVLLAILTFSYEQTIHTYPDGGGAYIVSRDNLGEMAALTAGASLLMDYILTVAVSISSSVAQIVSAFPEMYRYRVEIAVILIALITLINLRGAKEAGTAFAIPTFFFLITMYITVIVGLVRFFTGTLGTVPNPPDMDIEVTGALTTFLLLRAFANGTTSLTGVEAISNGITAFKEPRSKNAAITLLWMSGILASLLIAITFLSIRVGVLPVESETLISQLSRTIYGARGIPYLLVMASTTVILMMAANTAFAGFPRLGAMAAADGYLPRQLTYRGSRLVYSRGITLLAIAAALLVVIFRASVTGLIPLYAIGVFLSFTLSQTGMARRWWKTGHLAEGETVQERGSSLHYDSRWLPKMLINGLGAISTALVTIIFAVTKFSQGAYVVIIVMPILVALLLLIRRHYTQVARQLSLEKHATNVKSPRNRVIMPIGGVHRGTLAALRYARSLSDDITAVYVSMEESDAEKLVSKWEVWGEGVRLVIVTSPYRLMLEPLLQYIDTVDEARKPGEIITIVVPHFVPKHFWATWLHMRTAETLRKVLLNRENIVITEVPYQVH